jgi:hypothetical protein
LEAQKTGKEDMVSQLRRILKSMELDLAHSVAEVDQLKRLWEDKDGANAKRFKSGSISEDLLSMACMTQDLILPPLAEHLYDMGLIQSVVLFPPLTDERRPQAIEFIRTRPLNTWFCLKKILHAQGLPSGANLKCPKHDQGCASIMAKEEVRV